MLGFLLISRLGHQGANKHVQYCKVHCNIVLNCLHQHKYCFKIHDDLNLWVDLKINYYRLGYLIYDIFYGRGYFISMEMSNKILIVSLRGGKFEQKIAFQPA